MNTTLLPLDANGHDMPVLAPRTLTSHTLTNAASVALVADNDNTRIVRLFTAADDAVVGVGTAANVTMPLASGAPEYIKLDARLALYASGNGALHITLMG